jgi:hypothetical protein
MRYGCFLYVLLILPFAAQAETLSQFWHSVHSERLVAPDAGQLRQAEVLFRRLLTGESGPELRAAWAELGFELTGTRSERDPLLVLREFGEGSTQELFSGKGLFVVAPTRHSRTVLQVPHSFRDADTAEIALQLMANKNIRAAAWNTAPVVAPPHAAVLPELQVKPAADYLSAFSRALLTVMPEVRVVQLHSFERDKMYTASGRHADIILSGYGEQPNPALGRLGRCLKKRLHYTVRSFPFEVQEMGAANHMTGAAYNVIGEIMAEHGSEGFVHLAMSGPFRSEMRTYPDVRENLYACLSGE